MPTRRPAAITARARAGLLGTIRLFGIGLFYVGLAGALIGLRRRRARVLVYHACEPTEPDHLAGLQSNTPPEVFARHLAMLRRLYRIVPLETLARPDRPSRSLAITFDDGYASVYRHAWPLLKRHDAPATVFLVSSAVDDAAMVWVNELNALLRRHPNLTTPALTGALGLDPRTAPEMVIAYLRDHCDAATVDRLLDAARAAVGGAALRPAPGSAWYVTWSQVDEMRGGGVTFGNHTVTHPNLRFLPEAAVTAELRGCHDALAARFTPMPGFAHPFGAGDARSRDAALALGYTFVVELGEQGGRQDLTRLGRVPAADQSAAALFADLEVVEPLKAALKGWARHLRGYSS